MWRENARVTYTHVGDDEAIAAFHLLAECEGIVPALESAHAVAYAVRVAPSMPLSSNILVNLSGRGDKDLAEVSQGGGGRAVKRLRRRPFVRRKRKRRAAFIPYITAGDPNLEATVELVRALARAGADVIELGVPFSDPIADGPTNQRAAERSLATGTTLTGVLAAVEIIRQDLEIPIVLFTYANPVVRYGIDRFAEDASAAGIDGVLFTDVPAEEMAPFEEVARRQRPRPHHARHPDLGSSAYEGGSALRGWLPLPGVTNGRHRRAPRP